MIRVLSLGAGVQSTAVRPLDFYNDNELSAVAWLRELIDADLISAGEVDGRSISEIQAADLQGYRQCHFFAGIGGWPVALQLAGWPADRPVWTGSCPCQPFSAAGKRKGEADERHVWPEFHRLIRESRPPVVFGEQVASRDGYRWLAGVQADLEAEGFAFGAADLPAGGVGAPQIRQRLFWVACTGHRWKNEQRPAGEDTAKRGEEAIEPRRCSTVCSLGDAAGEHQRGEAAQDAQEAAGRRTTEPRDDGSLGRTDHERFQAGAGAGANTKPLGSNKTRPWDQFAIIHCRDGKYRRVPATADGRIEPALFPLAHGIPGRVGLLRGAGNAIVPQAATAFIRAFMQAELRDEGMGQDCSGVCGV